jgi:dipeptidyl aminopeptidase/acylaminoacyl peptidase
MILKEIKIMTRNIFKHVMALLVVAIIAPSAAAKLPDGAQIILDAKRSEFSQVEVSPSGKYISAMLRRDDRNTLVILDRKTGAPIDGKSIRYDETDNMEVAGGQWLSGDIYAYRVFIEDGKYRPSGSGDMFLLHMDKPVNERIWSWKGNYLKGRGGEKTFGSLGIISVLPNDKDNILVSISPWKRRDGGVRPIIYEMQLTTGNFKRVTVGPGRGAQLMSNIDGSMLGSIVPKDNLSSDYYFYNRSAEDSAWQSVSIDFPGKFSPLRMSNDGKYIYGLTQLEEGINASRNLVKLSSETGDYESVFDFGFVSSIRVSFDREDGHPIYATWIDDKPEIKVFKKDHNRAKVLAGFAKGFPGFLVSPTGNDDANNNLTFHVGSPGIRGEYYIWEKESGSARYLFSQQEKVDQLELNSFQSVKYETSDGVTLQGWLLMPRSGQAKSLINYIHGGPHGPYIDYFFNYRMQMLSEMGYAVFAPNFRGSGGYGNNLERSGYTKWGTRMLDDMRDGAEFIQKNYNVGAKVYTLGGSYGGYSSAQNVVRHNDYYDCSVIMAGFFEFDELKSTWDGRRGAFTGDYTDTAMGTESATLRAMSPIHNLDKVKVPLLILHGKADRRTPLAGAKKYVKALKKTDIDFRHHFYKNEGHGLYFDDNEQDQYEKIQTFLSQCDAREPLNPEVAMR